MPKAWTTVARSKEPVAAKAINMSEEVVGKGKCPACTKIMEGPVFCSGKPMRVCWPCRITLPYPDDEHSKHANSHVAYEHNPFGRSIS